MRHSPTLFAAVLLFLGTAHATRGDDKPTPKDLGKDIGRWLAHPKPNDRLGR